MPNKTLVLCGKSSPNRQLFVEKVALGLYRRWGNAPRLERKNITRGFVKKYQNLFFAKSGCTQKCASRKSIKNYLITLITTPEPTVLPPSRIAKRRPFSIAIGAMSSTFMSTLSPGLHISTPSGRVMIPVTSVVLK